MQEEQKAVEVTATPVQTPTGRFIELMEKGLVTMTRVLQEVKMTRQDTVDLLNFESVVRMVIDGQKAVEGKSLDEILKMRADLEAKLKEQQAQQAA